VLAMTVRRGMAAPPNTIWPAPGCGVPRASSQLLGARHELVDPHSLAAG